jgi:hypothetical protein
MKSKYVINQRQVNKTPVKISKMKFECPEKPIKGAQRNAIVPQGSNISADILNAEYQNTPIKKEQRKYLIVSYENKMLIKIFDGRKCPDAPNKVRRRRYRVVSQENNRKQILIFDAPIS